MVIGQGIAEIWRFFNLKKWQLSTIFDFLKF